MHIRSIPTRGRTLDMAASVYDFIEPLLLLEQQKVINQDLLTLLEIEPSHRILDMGCGTGVLTSLIAEKLDAKEGGCSVGIDAAGKMIAAARNKRGRLSCEFEAMAAEDLLFEDESFDSVVSSFFSTIFSLISKKEHLPKLTGFLNPGAGWL